MLIPMLVLGIISAGIERSDVEQSASPPPPMKCETGPVTKIFGGTSWIVYSCDDQASLVVVTAQGNPASPFFFMLKPNGGTYTISGEGNGSRAASEAARNDLSKMKPADFAALLAETKATGAKR